MLLTAAENARITETTSNSDTCLYARCPYGKAVNVFRDSPEKWDILYAREKADKNRRP